MKQGRRIFDISGFELLKFFFASSFPELCRKLKIRANPKEPADFFLNTFVQTLEYRQSNNIKRNDFVSMLLRLKEFFTNEELAAEAFLVYIGGFETSSTLMTFALYELAINPNIQERLRDEIKSTTIDSYDSLVGMKYLDMVINETLRKYPPIPNTARRSTKDYVIPGTKLTIEKGTSIEIAIYSLHHDPEHFPEPQKFDPERFTTKNVEARNPFTFIPFGAGPRNVCIISSVIQFQDAKKTFEILHSA